MWVRLAWLPRCRRDSPQLCVAPLPMQKLRRARSARFTVTPLCAENAPGDLFCG